MSWIQKLRILFRDSSQLKLGRDNDVLLRDSSGTEVGKSGNPLRNDPTGTTTQPVSGTVTTIPSGTQTVAFSQTGANNDIDVLSIAAGNNNIGDVDIVTMPNVILAAGTNTNEVVGDVAHNVAIAGNPLRIGFRGLSSDYAAVTTGNTADAISDLNGKQIILPYAIPENFVNGIATLTGTGDTVVIAAGAAGIRNYITSLSVSNTSATAVRVDFKDGTTIVCSFYVAASGGGATMTLPVPIRGTAATAFNAALSAAVTDVRVSAQGYRAP